MSLPSMSETAIAHQTPTPDENAAPSASPKKLRLSPPADPRRLGNMIQATKLLAGTGTASGIGLRHAKDAIDQIMAGRTTMVLLPQAPEDIKKPVGGFRHRGCPAGDLSSPPPRCPTEPDQLK